MYKKKQYQKKFTEYVDLIYYCAAGRRFVVEDPHHPLLRPLHPQDKIKIQKPKITCIWW